MARPVPSAGHDGAVTGAETTDEATAPDPSGQPGHTRDHAAPVGEPVDLGVGDPSEPAADALTLLDAVVDERGGQVRAGQRQMCAAVADALADSRHLIVEAPTGTGKTYAVAAAAATFLARADDTGDADDDPEDRRVVIATATRALQDQLVDEDLPAVASVTGAAGQDLAAVVLKGRSNYLCLARADRELGSILDDDRDRTTALIEAAEEAGSGARTDLPDVDDGAWGRLSCPASECPGAAKCSSGEVCWAELARRRAAEADVVVVSTALYAAHLLADGAVLPPHRAVVVDEAHALADILVSAAALSVSPTRLRNVERIVRSHADAEDAARLLRAADGLAEELEGRDGEVDPTEGDLAVHLADARAAIRGAARRAADTDGDEAAQAAKAAANLAQDLAVLGQPPDDLVVWCEGDRRLQASPIEADALGAGLLWPGRTVVCTSATLQGADTGGHRSFDAFRAATGAPGSARTLAVDSPFDHARQGMLYVPKGRIPSPREDGWRAGVADELWGLATAAGGRTLALFTSRSATEDAAEALRARIEEEGSDLEVLTQWDASRQRLVDALRRRRKVVLCATRSFWTGIDIPGDACVVVAIDRLPFPRPDDPLISARRQAAEERGASSFVAVDLPMAATQLAQGVGRLIRTPTDRGVVAVLDTRLATARWRGAILGALPPLKRSIDPDEVAAFLADA